MEHRPAPGAADARRTPMNPNFLDFEQPIADLQAKIEELRLVGNDNALNISDEISRLQDKSSTLTETIFGNLSSWQISQLSRHPRRPYTLDYIEHIFTEFDELHGDRHVSDDAGDRPGMRALRELSVRSPLRECGLTKDEIRRLSREVGLFTWDKPAYACLATRIPTGQPITARDLAVTEAAETYLFSLGFTDFRVRLAGRSAKIQLPAAQMPRLLEHRQEILDRLGPDYDGVWLDLEGRG